MQVLQAFRKHIFRHKNLRWMHMLYNGHGTVRTSYKMAAEAGKWCCENGELIGIEEILVILNEKAEQQEEGFNVFIHSDCCGSTGQFTALLDMLNSGTLTLSK